MLVTALELPATWGDPRRALADVDARIAAGPRSDLVVLPEASLHGYVSPRRDFDLAPFAEPLDGPTARACADVARVHGVHLVAPLVLAEGAAIYNAMICFGPAGEVVFVYRKRHPWVPETWATAGPLPPPVVMIAGRAVTIAVCYDVHFLPDDAPRALAAADVLIFPSAWVESPDHRADHLADLARQFDVAVVNANWAPGVVRVPGQGNSCILAQGGALLARAPLGGRVDATL